MRKNSKKNGLITKDYLDKRLKNEFSKHTDRLIKYIDFRLEPVENFMKKFDKFHEIVLNKLDWLVKAYEKYDQEYAAASERNNRIDARLQNHDKRISVLEKKTVYKAS